jgi:lysozyme family protein
MPGWSDLYDFMMQPKYDGFRQDRAPGEMFDTCRGVTEMLRAEAERRGIAPAGVALQDLDDDQLEAILRWECWTPICGDLLAARGAPGVAFLLGNMAAMAGARAAIMLAQRLLGGLVVDGVIGPKTLTAILAAAASGSSLMQRLATADDEYFSQCRQASVFLRGWEARIADAVATASRLG